jgi:hypothetical protein
MTDATDLDPLRVALIVTDILEALGAPYFIGGSLASIFHGLIRTTNDADIVAALTLDWYRLGGEVSERQWRDVLGIIKTQASRLDHEYLTRWADELGVADLLARALVAATT